MRRERNHVKVGAIGLVIIAAVVLIAFFAGDLPIIGSGTTYRANFSEAGGIHPGDEVRVAGVKVGKVTKVGLDGDHVQVTFKVSNAWIGDRTTAAIKIKTLLGQKVLSLDPQGGAALSPGTPIPRERTMSPYDVSEAFNGLATTVGQIDTNQLAQSFTVLSNTFKDTPANVKGALDGLSKLSQTISSRDDQLRQLLGNTSTFTKTVADRDAELEKLLGDGNTLLSEVRKRRDAIAALLTGTRNLSAQLKGLVADNTDQLRPALEQLDKVATVLQRNQDNLSQGMRLLAPFIRVFTNAVGNGRWFDSYICGLLPPAIGPVNEQGCAP